MNAKEQNTLEELLRQLLQKLDEKAGPTRILRDPEILEYCGLKRSQRDYLISKGDFPQPIRLAGKDGRAKGWAADEVAAWQRKRLAERDAHH